uniref:COP9 signalosome complex subunit 6 n=1 Tax=Tetraselmis sp. GSL018 TaxID=582737 RepID=A0A061R7N5_9CHLO|mmetsp:Transcript_514/g.1129  ORF Transcript_514/g.1129 Transcript_514/m.1129 type:complete len:307 (+) Transcript_514:66-986(+)|eukprot:CAMPEP_0177599188 /NCGR_PEP_ID=MMETSP0419_2-20121207/12830_1 /TAXON_ID=582737 /ORGANISM="Tetraselmis sp., Strain GSL018" /LENGTH=306 /DNA_ID=CAMNT_0019091845 /DNA_START=58 /DNA_END=978 /DNA_ORIENTATION=+
METPKQSSSGLEFKLHPLVLVNISDHHTRTKLNSRVIEPNSGTVPVLGCLLGLHTGLTVEITNSFEVLHEVKDGVLVPDSAFLTTKQDQYKRVFPSLDVVGWYTTGEAPREEHLSTHKMMMDINESPVFLLLNPAPSASSKDLPIALYESELHVVDGANTLKLSCANYNIETSEAERIAVDQVTKLVPSGGADGSAQVSAHLGSLHAALKMLVSRLRLLLSVLRKMKGGEAVYDHAIVRQVVSLSRSLPAIEGKEFQEQFLTDYNDSLLVIYLASITKGTAVLNDLIDRFNLAFEKGTRRRAAVGM